MLNQSRRYKILIVDEDNFDRSTLNMLIGDEFDTIFAYDGHEAVETYFVEKPDLVFMSIVIPVKNGFESLDEIEGKNIFFLLKAKCEKVARELGVRYLDIVFKRSKYYKWSR